MRPCNCSISNFCSFLGSPYVRPMEPISAIAGKSLKIICPVAGYPIDSVTWERDNVKLPTTMWHRVFNGTLLVENVQRAADQGTYTCTARNRHNETSERSVAVKVLGKLNQSDRMNFVHWIVLIIEKSILYGMETNALHQHSIYHKFTRNCSLFFLMHTNPPRTQQTQYAPFANQFK